MHTVIPGIGRVLKEPARLGGLELPEGTLVACSSLLLHYDATLFPEPHTFRPERFLTNPPKPNTFFPFGGGLRRCIGVAFALYEMKIVLATLLHAHVPVASGRPVRTRRRNITLTPSGGLPIRFERRTR